MAFHASQLPLLLAACALSPFCDATQSGGVRKSTEAVAINEIEIPKWKLDLVTGESGDWWSKYGFTGLSSAVSSAIWGNGMPSITGSPGQDKGKCPVIKLPDNVVMSAKYNTWSSLYGEWQTQGAVKLATWEQNYMGMGFSRDIKRIGVYFRSPATGDLALRTRYFSNSEMIRLYDWKEPIRGSGYKSTVKNTTAIRENTFEDIEAAWNLGIFDCQGTLMYVVKQMTEFPKDLVLYSRDGQILAESFVGNPVKKFAFVDPKTGYLLAEAEAPGIGSNVESGQLPDSAKVHNVLPFGMKFQTGGYKNSSGLVEPEYRWILAAAVQALAIYDAPQSSINDVPWSTITAVELFYVLLIMAALATLVGLVVGIYFCVYPSGRAGTGKDYGRLAENPFLGVPARPPHRDELRAESRLNADREMGMHSRQFGYGANY